jgi:MFS family permease
VSAAASRVGAAPPASGGEGSPPTAGLARLPSAWTITAALAVVYLILAPASPDLAAASYRSSLFSSAGFTLWDNSWYGGHHLLAYSVLAPALGALIGPRLLAALSMVIATALFASLIDGWFPTRATRIAAAWFALGASVALLSSRVPFDLGLAVGLGALLAARRRRLAIALALSVLASLASPVAGAFLALAFLAWALAGQARAWPAALTLAALVPIALLTLAFPEGGSQPFVASAFFPEIVGVLIVLALVERERRMLRIGLALYALALVGSYLVPSAVGGNADRLGALVAGPVAACALACASRERRRALLVLAPFLLYWQANAPVADFASTVSNPSVEASFYTPLIGELRALGVGYGARPVRIEVVATADHWEARYLAPHVMIARGWERQLDTYRNGIFYEESKPLTAARYHRWLAQNSISYVALPDAALDYSARAEARLVGSERPAYLREIWHSAHWRLFAVLDASPLAQAPAVLRSASSDSLSLYAPRPGAYLVRVRFTPYWALGSGSGCVSRAPGEWTEVRARRAGELHVIIRFSLARVFDHGPRCS